MMLPKKEGPTKAMKKVEPKEFKNAYVIPAELGDALQLAIMEMPLKYEELLKPLLQGLKQAHRVDVAIAPPKENEDAK